MNKRLLAVAVTIAVFAAGLLTGIWIQRNQPVPPPPIALMGELRDTPVMSSGARPPAAAKREEPSSNLKAELERIKPEIDAFRKNLGPIKSEFKNGLQAILTPEQQAMLKAENDLKRRQSAAADAANKDRDKPRRYDPAEAMIPIIVISNTLEELANDAKLTAEQKTAVQQLLLQRRAQFLELIDRTPPPSLKLGKIAPLVVGKPESK